MSHVPLLALFARADGRRLYDNAAPRGPVAVVWRGLPEHPHALRARGVKVTDSTRPFGSLGEADIRSIVRQARAARTASRRPAIEDAVP